ncbi:MULTISPECIES: carbohydrate ABC transporter permease [unclassified Streptomyces]|uniref:carbohydrate ABC transporter permease n=1 Tax=unclassified Streptomyces TaxID=2593676 RepID=UPI000DD6A200|nr:MULTISPECIES: sugar ABC transporter permease [unclassified Streptomyces]QZZ25393.1 sugar ABC transporter permease [Streptomyces sp. ST1015]
MTTRPKTTPPWWFALPALLLFAFVVLVPSARGVYYAFTDWDGLDPGFSFVGLGNFADMLDDPDALAAVRHTLLIAVSVTVVQNGLGLLLALGVNSAIKSRNLLRVLLFAPAVITPIVTAYLWRNLLGPDGAVNSALGGRGQDWLGDPELALWSVVGVVVWQFAGYSMVIFLAGLQSVPKELHEAAQLDGAGPVRRFWSVTRPLLAPALTINLMLSVIGGIKLFDQVYALTGGGPGHATDTISTLIYKDAFTLGEFGYSIALAVVLTIVVAVVSTGQYALLARSERSAS